MKEGENLKVIFVLLSASRSANIDEIINGCLKL